MNDDHNRDYRLYIIEVVDIYAMQSLNASLIRRDPN